MFPGKLRKQKKFVLREETVKGTYLVERYFWSDSPHRPRAKRTPVLPYLTESDFVLFFHVHFFRKGQFERNIAATTKRSHVARKRYFYWNRFSSSANPEF